MVYKIIGFLSILILIIFVNWIIFGGHFQVKHGEKIISNLTQYQMAHNKLPESHDRDTLVDILEIKYSDRSEVGMEDFLSPEYLKIDDSNYSLTFLKGFDGPYLKYDTIRKKWYKGH